MVFKYFFRSNYHNNSTFFSNKITHYMIRYMNLHTNVIKEQALISFYFSTVAMVDERLSILFWRLIFYVKTHVHVKLIFLTDTLRPHISLYLFDQAPWNDIKKFFLQTVQVVQLRKMLFSITLVTSKKMTFNQS